MILDRSMALTMRRVLPVVVLLLSTVVQAGDVSFRRHAVDLEATFSAAAAVDVNRDGRLDIVSGKWWYAAPDWSRSSAAGTTTMPTCRST
jgi:hypothetical protein